MRAVETFIGKTSVRINGVENEGVGDEVDGEPEEQVEEGGEARFAQYEDGDEAEEREVEDDPVAGKGAKNNSRWKPMNLPSEMILGKNITIRL